MLGYSHWEGSFCISDHSLRPLHAWGRSSISEATILYYTILVCTSLFRDKEQIAVSNRTVKYLLSLFSLSLSKCKGWQTISVVPKYAEEFKVCWDTSPFVPSSHITSCSILNAEVFLWEEVFSSPTSLSDNFEVFLLADGWLCCCKGDSREVEQVWKTHHCSTYSKLWLENTGAMLWSRHGLCPHETHQLESSENWNEKVPGDGQKKQMWWLWFKYTNHDKLLCRYTKQHRIHSATSSIFTATAVTTVLQQRPQTFNSFVNGSPPCNLHKDLSFAWWSLSRDKHFCTLLADMSLWMWHFATPQSHSTDFFSVLL